MPKHPRILIADDEPGIIDMLAPFFEEGYIVVTATKGDRSWML